MFQHPASYVYAYHWLSDLLLALPQLHFFLLASIFFQKINKKVRKKSLFFVSLLLL